MLAGRYINYVHTLVKGETKALDSVKRKVSNKRQEGLVSLLFWIITLISTFLKIKKNLPHGLQDVLTGKYNTTFEIPAELKYQVGGQPSEDNVVNIFLTNLSYLTLKPANLIDF